MQPQRLPAFMGQLKQENMELHASAHRAKVYAWDLSKVYLPELLERVSAGEVLQADNKQPIDLHQFYSLLICNGV